MNKRVGPSLKARAVGFLSRREHSRAELRRKLAPHSEDAAELEAVLDGLEAGQWQSDARFAQSYVQRKAGRQGTQRILHALREQGVADSHLSELRASLVATEADRAQSVWAHKFGRPPADQREYARQFRFLAGRGFSSESIRQVLRTAQAEFPDD